MMKEEIEIENVKAKIADCCWMRSRRRGTKVW